MSYLRPIGPNADATWDGATQYVRPLYSLADASFLESGSGAGGAEVSIVDTVQIGDFIDAFIPNRYVTQAFSVGDVASAINVTKAVLEFVSDSTIHYDWTARYTMFQEAVTEIASILDYESITFNGVSYFYSSATDRLEITPDITALNTKRDEIIESLAAIDSPDFHTVISITIQDLIETITTTLTGRSTTIEVFQTFNLSASIFAAFPKEASELINIASSLVGEKFILRELLDKTTVSASVDSNARFMAAAAILLYLDDIVSSGKGGTVVDDLSLSVETEGDLIAVLSLLESLIVEDTPSMTGVLSFNAISSLELSSSLTINQIISNAINENVSFYISFALDDTVYSGVVMNTNSKAVSMYTNFNFNSFAEVNNKYYGSGPDGLFLLGGDDDAGKQIAAKVRMGLTNFGSDMLKRLDSAYLGFRSEGTMVLKVETEGGVERWYEVKGTTDKLHKRRIHPLAKGHKAVWWQFELVNVDGADFELSEIELVPVQLSRRV